MAKNEELYATALDLFKKQFSRKPEKIVAAPGRANIIGEHTDYNDGHVLPIAIDRYTVAAGTNRPDRVFKLYTGNLKENFEFDMDNIPQKRPQWVSYMMGVVVEMEKDGFKISGKEIAVYGNVPIGSGLSSSAALEIATATVIEQLEGWNIEDARMVNICRRADHNFVGVNSGPMDQFASRACRKGHAGLLDCRSLEMTHHKLPDNILFLSIYSGIPRSLAASEYNERQESCQKAVEILKKTNPGITALRDATTEMVETAKHELGDRVYKRAKHVVTEEKRVFEILDAFTANDLPRIGEVLLEGHKSLSVDYEVSLPILDEMIEWFYKQTGVIGARLTGAGFGGSLICLVETEKTDIEELSSSFIKEFKNRTPESPEIWRLTTVDGAKYNY